MSIRWEVDVVDPLSLSVLGGVALTEGIKFLYAQATELLKRRREQAGAADPAAAPTTTELVGQQPQVLDGSPTSGPVDLDVVAQRETALRELRRGLADYAEGLADVRADDDEVLQQVAALRGLLELVYGQHLTFRGEQRPATGSPLRPDAEEDVRRLITTVTVTGAGAVGIGGSNSGSISTSTTTTTGTTGSAPASRS